MPALVTEELTLGALEKAAPNPQRLPDLERGRGRVVPAMS
jgi:hypothetical protein